MPRALARGKYRKHKTALAETMKQQIVAKAKFKSSLIHDLKVVAILIKLNSNPNSNKLILESQ
ncbi:MAG: hypothetical protein A2X08_10025 [Bacteroidetes bacterium GWA2_32_17]|nr:MAG: hypothetical protein A2X08_10025 [Bacteroidetes bacterium GWA2_32_17]